MLGHSDEAELVLQHVLEFAKHGAEFTFVVIEQVIEGYIFAVMRSRTAGDSASAKSPRCSSSCYASASPTSALSFFSHSRGSALTAQNINCTGEVNTSQESKEDGGSNVDTRAGLTGSLADVQVRRWE